MPFVAADAKQKGNMHEKTFQLNVAPLQPTDVAELTQWQSILTPRSGDCPQPLTFSLKYTLCAGAAWMFAGVLRCVEANRKS
jgi:hypothetical protein